MTQRRLNSATGLLTIFVCSALLAGEAKPKPPAVAPKPKSPDLLAKLPAQTVAEGQKIAAEIVKLGPAAVKQVCGMLVPADKGGDVKARYALSGLAFHVSRPDAEAERQMVAGVLIEALKSDAPAEVKAFFVRQLELVGKDDAVAPLNAFLADKQLCDPATQALVQIGTPKAIDVLTKALAAAKGSSRVTIIQALGVSRVAAAAKPILADATSKDAKLRIAAMDALANIGDPCAADVLSKAAAATQPYERSQATKRHLLFARRLAEAGKKQQCAQICRDLVKTRKGPRESNVVCTALRTLVLAEGANARPDLLAAANHDNKQIREAALKLGLAMPGEAVTKEWIEKMQSDARAPEEIVAMLGRRGDKSAVPAVLAALKHKDAPVRLAAAQAAVRLDKAAALPALLAAMKTDQSGDISALKRIVMQLGEPAVMPAVAEALPKVPASSRVALVEVLAARRAKAQAETVFKAAKDEDPSVRVAALKGLADLTDDKALPRLVGLLLEATTSREHSAAQKTVVTVSEKIKDPQQRAEPVLAAMAKTKEAKPRALLLRTVARIGGKKALDTVLADMKSTDATTQDAALRALADWRDASACPHLLNVARSSEKLVHQVLALRGYVRLVETDTSMKDDKKLQMYKDGMGLAKRPDEKKMVLAGLGKVRSVDALKFVAPYLDDAALQREAAAAAAKMACPKDKKDKGLCGATAKEVLTKVVAVCKDDKVRKQVQQHLDSMPIPDEFNLAQGRPVKTSIRHQGNCLPELAVDGNTVERHKSAWFGDKYPCWLQVDFEKPAEIDAAHVFFYWDGKRYYQYKLETSLDGKAWKTVLDMSKNTKPGTSKGVMHHFPKTQARYVRINILKNSSNPAVHLVEFKVYAAGKAPKPKPKVKPKPDKEGFVSLFNGKDVTGWAGATKGYVAEKGNLVCLQKGGGHLYTEDAYDNFIFRFEFKLPPGGNNGVGIRVPMGGHPAGAGMEIQVLDNTAEKYAKLKPCQYHGSIYCHVPAKRGHLKPVGQWNQEDIIANGRQITVILNGVTIVDANLDDVIKEKTKAGGKAAPGLSNKTGHVCFCGHGCRVEFRNIRVKELKAAAKGK